MLSKNLRLMVACLPALLQLGSGCDATETPLMRLAESRRLAERLRVGFSRAADASNRAVMAANADDAARIARESNDAFGDVDANAAALADLVRASGYSNALMLLGEVRSCLSQYRKLDGRVLSLAIENTNLHAQEMSFTAATEAAAAVESALEPLAASVPAVDRCRVEVLVADVLLGVREIQILHHPHIAERDEGVMDRLERAMAASRGRAQAALRSLELVSSGKQQRALFRAFTALTRFEAVSTQIVALSRRNTNVRAIELSLRDKPALIASCNERLGALQEDLAERGSKATR